MLRINSHLPRILQLINAYNITAVIAPPGLGQSLGIPAAIASAGSRIFVSVPTMALVQSLVKEQLSLNPKLNVGYAGDTIIKYDDNSQIVYATSDYIRRLLLSYIKCLPLTFTDVLMIDDIQINSLDHHVILALWNYCPDVPRLVLSGSSKSTSLIDAAVIYEIKSETYPIEIRYHHQNYDPDDSQLISDTVTMINTFYHSINQGHILVIVSSSSEVEAIKSLSDVPIISELSTPTQPRQIIIATSTNDLAISDISVVIDTMIERRAETSLTGGFRINNHHIAQATAQQRCELTGRTMSGLCYRMCTQDFYRRLPKVKPDEMFRVPIYPTIMELLSVKLDPISVLTDVPKDQLLQTMSLLNQLEPGKFVTEFPLGLRTGTVLWNWVKDERQLPLFPGIVIVSLIDCFGPSFFWYPMRSKNQTSAEYNLARQEHQDKFFTKFEGPSGVHTLVNLWNDLMTTTGGMEAPRMEVIQWARDHRVNPKIFLEVKDIVQQCINAARHLGYEVEVGPFTTEGAVDAIRPLIQKSYADLIMRRIQLNIYIHDPTGVTYRLSDLGAGTTNQPPFLIALLTEKTPLNLISLALDLNQADEVPLLSPEIPPKLSQTEIMRTLDLLNKL